MNISTLERLNPFLPEVIADPYPVYARYRETEPVHWGIAAKPQLPGAWYLFRYQDVMQVLEDRRFGREGHKVRDDIDTAPVPKAYKGFSSMVSNWMVFRDPPNHTRLRLLVNKAFSPKTLEDLRPAIVDIADGLLERVKNRTEIDLIDDFAFPLPVMVIAALLGVDPEDRFAFREWALALQHASASRLTPSPEVYEQAEAATQSFIEYFQNAIAQRHAQPRNDLITALAKARYEGDKLNDEEILATCIHLLTAGHETTINLIAKGTLALLRNPQQMELLRAHPELISSAVEELIRYDSPVQMLSRWAYEDVEIGGKLIRRGDSVGLMLGSANRDRNQFNNPDSLNIGREDNKHCGFGGGIHFCLGSALARAEAQISLNILINRFPKLSLIDQPIQWADNIVFHGPKHLSLNIEQ
ncbi:MAG: cytochrome P450 [Pleurocapsa sp.]